MPVPDLLGVVGVSIVLLAFILLQSARVEFDDYSYLALNGVGAALGVFSLFFEFNLSVMLMEGAWVLVSAYGFVRRVSQTE